MSEQGYTQEFWVGTVGDWLIKNAGVRKERIDPQRKFTQEPYNLSVVRVLNMMDDLVEIYKSVNKKSFTLTQNWRLTHRGDRVGDFIAAFYELVAAEDVDRQVKQAAPPAAAPAPPPPRPSGADDTPADVSESGQKGMHSKRLEALRADPGGDWTPADLEITASQYAIKFRKTTGTHEVFLHPSVPTCVTVPLRKKIRIPHIKAFVAMIDRMEKLER